MADAASKGKKTKQSDGVLGGLPATRPSRMSRRARGGGPSVEATRAAASRAADTREATGSRASGKRTTAADKTRKSAPAARKPSTAKTTAKAAPAKATASKANAAPAKATASKAKAAPAKATASKATAPKAAAKAKTAAPKKAGPARLAPVAPIGEGAKPARKPRAVRPATPTLKEPTEKAEARREDVPVARPAQSGPELVTTVVQAAGELASIGVTIGGQILKRAASRLPRP